MALPEAAYSAALSSAGDIQGAVDHAIEGTRLAEAAGDESGKLAVRVRLAADGVAGAADAEAALEEALRHAEQTGQRGYRPEIHLSYAELARVRGDHQRRQRELAEAEKGFIEIGAIARARKAAADRETG